MKTLETTIPSGTYLVLDLPEDARNVYITEQVDLGEDHFVLPAIHYTSYNDRANVLPEGEWSKIGFGKDHPELVNELGLLSENLVNPVYDLDKTFKHDKSIRLGAIGRYNRQLVEHEQAEKRVFKNPYILQKNDPN